MKRVYIVHNIPAPYRVYLFNTIQNQLSHNGLGLHVFFMAVNHDDRPRSWSDALQNAEFHFSVDRDLGFNIGGRKLHLNPLIVLRLLFRSPVTVLIGGPWDSLTALLVTLLPQHRKIAWIETNTHTPGRVSGLSGILKRWLLKRCEKVAVPGKEGLGYLELLFGCDKIPTPLLLPNIVDPSLFINVRQSIEAAKIRQRILGARRDRNIAIWPARLVPAKGVLEFINLLSQVDLSAWVVALVGDGELRASVDTALKDSKSILRLDYVPYCEMPALYGAADLFVLPSFSDPNPLSVVEAMHAGLPLLISRYLGNAADVLEIDGNGWCFDPKNPAAAVSVAAIAFATPINELRLLGRRSAEIASESWSPESATKPLIEALVQ
jgi:glycosyltransferase involved in cell wall biosynthesis